jgi:hypothetical protein
MLHRKRRPQPRTSLRNDGGTVRRSLGGQTQFIRSGSQNRDPQGGGREVKPNAHALAEERSDDSQKRVVGNSGGSNA